MRRKNLTTGEKFQLYTIRIMVNVVVLFILAGAAWLIIWTTLQSLEVSKLAYHHCLFIRKKSYTKFPLAYHMDNITFTRGKQISISSLSFY